METIDCPCIGCICAPRCRHKSFTALIFDCAHISILLYDHYLADKRYRKEGFEENVTKVEEYLKPTKWYIEIFQDPHEPFLTIQRIDDEP